MVRAHHNVESTLCHHKKKAWGLQFRAHRIVRHLRALVLINAHYIPEAGIHCKYQQTQDHRSQHEAAHDTMHPVRIVPVAILVLGRIDQDLVHEQAQQCHGADVLDRHIERHDVEQHISGFRVHMQKRPG